MILTLKNLQQQTLTVDVDPNETVAQVKTKIEEKEKHPASWQKLIFSGKVLDDSQTIASYGIKESDFLVLMVRKPPGAAAATTPAPAASPAKPAEAPKPVAETPKPAETTPAPTPAATTPAATGAPADSSLVTGTAYESTVNQLIEMGFPREDVVKALRAAFNNPDRAVEYLMNGIPNVPEVAASPARSPAPSTGSPQQRTAAPATGAQPTLSPTTPLIPPQFMGQQPAAPSSGGGVFDFLRQHPQFNTLRMMVQQNPELLQPVLQQLGQANPSILQLINQHQQEFIQLLNEPVAPGTGAPAPGPGGLGTPPSGAQYIQVTPEEKAAIERLEKMGFDRAQVVEAFFACDKDEQLAANYLLEHQFEDFDDDDQTNQ